MGIVANDPGRMRVVPRDSFADDRALWVPVFVLVNLALRLPLFTWKIDAVRVEERILDHLAVMMTVTELVHHLLGHLTHDVGPALSFDRSVSSFICVERPELVVFVLLGRVPAADQ